MVELLKSDLKKIKMLKKKFIGILILFLIYPLVVEGKQKSAFTFGSREISYTYSLLHNLQGEVYIYEDRFGHPLEQGVQLDWRPKEEHTFIFRISKINKDNLLDDAILTKFEWLRQKGLWREKITHDTKMGLGFFYLPSLFAEDSNYKPTLKRALAYYGYDKYTNAKPISLDKKHRTLLNLNLYLDGIIAIDPSEPKDGHVHSMFSYLRAGFGTKLKRKFTSNLDAEINYNGFIQLDESILPSSFFIIQNHEVSTTFNLQLPKELKIGISFYEPLRLGLIIQDYLYQGRRIEANLHTTDNWYLQGMTRFGNEHKELFTLKNYTTVILGKGCKNSDINLFWRKEEDDNRYGLEFRRGGKKSNLMQNILDKELNIPTKPSIHSENYYSLFNPPNVKGLGFEETIAKLDTPEKVAWYTGNYFNYDDDEYSTPEEVFNTKRGNCVEQMGFQAYVLRQHGYESYILQHIAIGSAHGICMYRDKTSGKWNALNYDNLYHAQAETPEELFSARYPGWFLLVIRDPSNGKPKVQFDSASRNYVIKWLER